MQLTQVQSNAKIIIRLKGEDYTTICCNRNAIAKNITLYSLNCQNRNGGGGCMHTTHTWGERGRGGERGREREGERGRGGG